MALQLPDIGLPGSAGQILTWGRHVGTALSLGLDSFPLLFQEDVARKSQSRQLSCLTHPDVHPAICQ